MSILPLLGKITSSCKTCKWKVDGELYLKKKKKKRYPRKGQFEHKHQLKKLKSYLAVYVLIKPIIMIYYTFFFIGLLVFLLNSPFLMNTCYVLTFVTFEYSSFKQSSLQLFS